mgnify:CR=1 FL=1
MACDPISAFGGIVSCNYKIKKKLAIELSKNFLEVIIANGFEKDALKILKKRKIKDLSFIESFQYGFDQTIWSMILMTTSLKMIFTGNVSRDDIGSVIMIGQMAGEAAQAGLTPFLMLMALISMNLAFINILPIPALDGGQIMVILIEMLLGKPLSIKTRMRIQSVGMYFLLALMAFLIINDILRVLS